MDFSIQINNLQLSERELERKLRKYGKVKDVWTTGRIPGFAVVRFEHPEIAKLFVWKMESKMYNTMGWLVEWYHVKRRDHWRSIKEIAKDNRSRSRSRSRSGSQRRNKRSSSRRHRSSTSAITTKQHDRKSNNEKTNMSEITKKNIISLAETKSIIATTPTHAPTHTEVDCPSSSGETLATTAETPLVKSVVELSTKSIRQLTSSSFIQQPSFFVSSTSCLEKPHISTLLKQAPLPVCAMVKINNMFSDTVNRVAFLILYFKNSEMKYEINLTDDIFHLDSAINKVCDNQPALFYSTVDLINKLPAVEFIENDFYHKLVKNLIDLCSSTLLVYSFFFVFY
jgi:hypothetical protein